MAAPDSITDPFKVYKQCTICLDVKETGEFYQEKSGQYRHACKVCCRTQAKASRARQKAQHAHAPLMPQGPKRCRKCLEIKDASAFYLRGTGRLTGRCKDCIGQAGAMYHTQHRDERLAYNHTYYLEHAEELRAYARGYHVEHREEAKAYSHAYYLAHADHWREQARLYHAMHREKRKIYARAYRLAHYEERIAYTHAYYRQHREVLLVYGRTYRRAHRETQQTYARVYRFTHKAQQQARDKAYGMVHRDRIRIRQRRYRVLHGERLRIKNKAWRKANRAKVRIYLQKSAARRRAQKANAPRMESFTILEIAMRDAWICHLCHTRVTRKNWSVDHIAHLSKGGSHTRDNVALAHRLCNSLRGNRDTIPVQTRLL